MAILEFKDVNFKYKENNSRDILRKVNVSFERGNFYAIVGPSGSGKTTAICLAGGLDKPTSGEVLFDGNSIKKIGYTNYRKKNISLIFQEFNLINYLTAVENVLVSMSISGSHKEDRKAYATKILMDLGLTEDETNRNVQKLSGGQQQRVAIARAIATDSPVIIADEPTGNLDSKTAVEITEILKDLAHKLDKCVIVVTHSKTVAEEADFSLALSDGELKQVKIV